MKNIIKRVEPGSPLDGRVFPGWALLRVNRQPILDVLDYKFHSYDNRLLLEFETETGKRRRIRLKKAEGEDPGLEFETYLMDRPRACANRCVFCFIDQNPPGMRQSIYFKDDDARLSFLMGCYITLTNLTEREIERIIALHISPVNISVHTTDPALRQRMLGNPRAGEVMAIMTRLAAAGITMNCQIVCCPGWNDGAALERTLFDLKALYPAVHSVSVVPVGLTRHREGLTPLELFTVERAGETIDLVTEFGNNCLAELGTRLAFCSDELYLQTGRDLPPDEFFEEHTQLENGVGMLRLLEAEFHAALDAGETSPDGQPFSIASGALAAPWIERLLRLAKERYSTLNGTVHSIRNIFYGETVTVAGLLTGGDLLEQLKGRNLGKRLLISADMLRRDEADFLDGVTLAELSAALCVPIYPVADDGAVLWEAMCGVLPDIPQPNRDAEETEYYPYH